MKSEKLIEQVEMYSNAIVAFAVLQAIAYSYAFGSNELFNCLVKSANYLAIGLTSLSLALMVLLVFAVRFCRRVLIDVITDHRDIVEKIYLGKMIAVVIFSLVPLLLTFHYGVIVDVGRVECNKLIRPCAGG